MCTASPERKIDFFWEKTLRPWGPSHLWGEANGPHMADCRVFSRHGPHPQLYIQENSRVAIQLGMMHS